MANGLYLTDTNLEFYADNLKCAEINSSGLAVLPGGDFSESTVLTEGGGSATNPLVTFGGVNTGLYSTPTSLSVAVNGDQALSMTTSGIDLQRGQYLAKQKAVSEPSYSFNVDTDTGVTQTSTGTLSMVGGGVELMKIDANRVTYQENVNFTSSGTTAVNFAGETTSGLQWTSADTFQCGVSAGTGLSVSTTNITHNARHYLPDGTVSLPAVSFTADTDTGFYRSGANEMSIACGGVQSFIFRSGTFNTIPGWSNLAGSGDILSVYSLGTSSPTLKLTGVDFNSQNHTVTWTRIGSYVHLQARLAWASAPVVGAGTLTITNLVPFNPTQIVNTPFITNSGSAGYGFVRTGLYFTIDTSGTVTGYAVDITDGTLINAHSPTDFTNNGEIFFCLDYYTT